MFDVRPYLYGGTLGAVIGSFATLEQAEAAFGPEYGTQILVILLRHTDGAGLTREVSRRSVTGTWTRNAQVA
jgi:hypothetical protein